MKVNQLTIQKTARVYQHGEPKNPKFKWLCLHGYGQLGQYFLTPFDGLDKEEHFLVAPEGFHRFYLNGTYGRVGASWMTKEDRLTDIADNFNYLNLVKINYLDNVSGKLVCFAFSQGAATLVRWLSSADVIPDILLIWAGSFPEDVEYPSLKQKLKQTKIIYAIGDEDEYRTPESIKKQEALLNSVSEKIIWVNFKGKHKIYPEVLEEIIERF